MDTFFEKLNNVIWGVPVLTLILLTGVVYTLQTRFIQIRLFPRACKEFLQSFQRNDEGISGYRALCTALAATVGTGNIVGVAGAIAIGGPGVVFWMWISALLGMVIKFSEVTLAVYFREKNAAGEWVGGPMYTIQNGLSPRFHCLAIIYCFFGIVASFGIGNATQMNAVMSGIEILFDSVGVTLQPVHIGVISISIGISIVLIFRHGANGIGSWAEKLVPPASVLYVSLTLLILLVRRETLPVVLQQIFTGAFSPSAVTCGVISTFSITLRVGTSRGVFTNEAGMGTASIAHSGAIGANPAQQGSLGIIEVFLDTIIMCTLTGLAILCSEIPIPFGMDPGIHLTLSAFANVLGQWSAYVVIILTCIFAFSTVLGWGLYGMRCMQYLFGQNVDQLYIALQFCAVIIGSHMKTSAVWIFSEMVNGLMAIPNLITLLLLLPVFQTLINGYAKHRNNSLHGFYKL